jgi:transcription initiation factor TFIIIB Brf1 subunit/transcription initiation factor TFIIB
MPSAAEYVETFCEVFKLGEKFKAGVLRLLAKAVTRGVRENSNAHLAAIALYLHAIQAGQHKLVDAIARMAQISPDELRDLAKKARVKMGIQV